TRDAHPLSLHDALPIYREASYQRFSRDDRMGLAHDRRHHEHVAFGQNVVELRGVEACQHVDGTGVDLLTRGRDVLFGAVGTEMPAGAVGEMACRGKEVLHAL